MIVNIKKRYFYGIIGLLVLAVGVFIVNALTPGVAPNPGHLITQVAPPAGCGDGQVLGWDGSSWSCVVLPVDTDTDDQELSLVGQKLSISSGNSVTIPSASGVLSCYYIQSGIYTINGNSGMCNTGYQYIGPNSASAHGGFCCKIN